MKFLLGTKGSMTQLFSEEGIVIPVTEIKTGPNVVTQVKTQDTDGYTAVQVGFETRRSIAKPQRGHLKDMENYRYSREFRSEETLKRGDVVTLEQFQEGDVIKVVGTSKGKGFAGVVKRHGFHGSRKTHGNKDQLRMPGSVGATGPAHVFKGVRMAGRMGNDRVTLPNCTVVKVDAETNSIFIRGAVPGARGSLVYLQSDAELDLEKVKNIFEKPEEEPVVEEVATEEVKTEEAAEEQPVEAQPEEKPAEENKEEVKEETSEEQPAAEPEVQEEQPKEETSEPQEEEQPKAE